MSAHTPGPWRLNALSAHKVIADSLEFVADCGTSSTHPAVENRCAANARLIAAAPDLLEAARGAVVLLKKLQAETNKLRNGSECSIGHYSTYHAETLTAAIAKSTAGES